MKYLLTFLLFTPLLLRAQTKDKVYIDSLQEVISKSKEDTVKADLLNRLSFTYLSSDPAAGIKIGEEGLLLSQKLGWKKGIAAAYNSIGSNYRVKADYPAALENFLKALEINEEIKNENGIAINLGNIGIVYKKQGEFENAVIYYEKALKLFEKMDDKKGMAANLGNIGIVYNTQKKFSKALEYESKALAIWEGLGNKKNSAIWLGNISLVYGDSGLYAEAIKYAEEALTINESLGIKKGIAENYRSLGSFYFGISKDSASSPATKSNARKLAIEFLEKAKSIANELGDLINLQEINEILFRVHEADGNYKAALENYRQFVFYKDSISSERAKEKITNLITQRELAIRDKEIKIGLQQIEIDRLAVAKKRNERFFYIAGILVLLVVIGIVYRNNRMQQRTNRLLAIEKEKSENLLLNILPAEVAVELKEKGTASAQHFDQVTVLLTDFVDFTRAAEKLSPQQLVDELHSCFKEFDGIISKYGIEKIKTVGDAYLAVSGLPVANAAHAVNMVSAAKEICAFMKLRKEQLGVDVFEVRIGIHSGSVVAGIVGVKKFAYDIWGDTVNTAARMEQNSTAGKINISQSTFDLVKSKFNCTYRGELEAKNKGKLAMYFVD
jgi:class 3 adenylate cyclase